MVVGNIGGMTASLHYDQEAKKGAKIPISFSMTCPKLPENFSLGSNS
jgi:hypothetical protein